MYLGRKTIIGVLLFGLTGVSLVFSADTLIVNLDKIFESDGEGSYGQKTQTFNIGDIKFFNKGNDIDRVGDYFTGGYYDEAFGFFSFDAVAIPQRVRVSSSSTIQCGAGYPGSGYLLEGYSYSADYGLVDFQIGTSSGQNVYICYPDDPKLPATIGGYAYGSAIGFQNFDGLELDITIDIDEDLNNEDKYGPGGLAGRFLKIDGIVASSDTNYEIALDDYASDQKVVGQVTKPSLKADMQRRVFEVTRYLDPKYQNTQLTVSVTDLELDTWDINNIESYGTTIQNGSITYVGAEDGYESNSLLVTLEGANTLTGSKTLIVHGANIYITNNILQGSGDGILGLIALEKDGVGGNIYIHPAVTDVHAIMFADRSLLSYAQGEGDNGLFYENQDTAYNLRNQLFLKGSVFSENTIGGYNYVNASTTTLKCPFFVEEGGCDEEMAKRYDMNYLRRYTLLLDENENYIARYDGQPSMMQGVDESKKNNDGDFDEEYEKFPFVIEYDPRVQTSPPPIFD